MVTTVLNRKKSPKGTPVMTASLAKPAEYLLDNGIPVYEINAGEQEVVKLEFIFRAGSWFQNAPLTAGAANRLLKAGTRRFTSARIAAKVDYYGAFLETSADRDHAVVALYCLGKYVAALLPLLEEVIKLPSYPADEVIQEMQRQKQDFITGNRKVNFIARNKAFELVFGKYHPYGMSPAEEYYDNLQRDWLVTFHQSHYVSNNCRIIASGKLPDGLAGMLQQHFGINDWTCDGHHDFRDFRIETSPVTHHFIAREDAVQSAIRIGKPLFNKLHPDFQGLQVLNTLLGGYFGSRLMANIREAKGYTYGINSSLISYKNAGCFFISTETGTSYTVPAIREIYRELRRLREEPVKKAELDLVRNYLLGVFMRSLDGPFEMAEKLKELLVYGLDSSWYQKYIETVNGITPAQLQSLAVTYFQEDTFTELIVGQNNS